MGARANNRSSRGSQRDLWGAKLFAKKGLRAWRTVPIIHATGKTPRPHTDTMSTTLKVRRFDTIREAVAASGRELTQRDSDQIEFNDQHEATKGALLLDFGTVLIIRHWPESKTISQFKPFADSTPFNDRDNLVSVVSLKGDTLTHVGRMPLKEAQAISLAEEDKFTA